MNAFPCTLFRSELTEGLRLARPLSPAAQVHALECADCRAFLEREERLDALLELLPEDPGPPELALRVRAAVNGARADAALERLLDELPPPAVPADLAARVLRALEPRRRPPALVRRVLRPLAVLAAAAALLLALLLWRRDPEPEPRVVLEDPGRPAEAEAPVPLAEAEAEDEDLLAYALERWELLADDDLDLWLAGLDPLDQTLIEVSGAEVLTELDLEGGTDGPR